MIVLSFPEKGAGAAGNFLSNLLGTFLVLTMWAACDPLLGSL